MLNRIVNRPIAVLMLSSAVALFGLLAYQQLSIALMPPLTYPSLTVQAHYQGASPEEVEAELTNPIEEALSTLEGLVSMSSRSSAGLSEMTLNLRWSSHLDHALQRIHERLDRLQFPEGVDPPLILRYDPTLEPLLVLSLSPDPEYTKTSTDQRRNLSDIRRYAVDVLAPLLYQVDGVAAVKVTGGERPIIDVKLSHEALQRNGVTIDQVRQALSASHINQAGGLLRTERGDILVRTVAELKSLRELKSLVIQTSNPIAANQTSQGTTFPSLSSVITLGDLASVERGFEDRTSWVQLDQSPAVRVQIYRRADRDLVAVSQSIRQLLFGKNAQTARQGISELTVRHPVGVQAALISDQAQFIEKALTEVKSAIFIGGLLAIIILYSFLASWSQTLIIAVSIPLSVVLTFVPLQLAEVSLNLMSLGGLALGIGMLVDNAVVVLESISRARERGLPSLQAAVAGTREVGSAVFASTLTTIAVFAPVAFIDGFAGQLFRDLALTVVSALSASLLVALLVVPTLSARSGSPTDALPPPSLSTRLQLNQWHRWGSSLRTGSIFSKLIKFLSLPLIGLEWILTLVTISFLTSMGLLFTLTQLLIRPLLRLVLYLPSLAAQMTLRLYLAVERGYLFTLKVTTRHPIWVIMITVVFVLLAFTLQSRLPRILLPEVNQGVLIVDLDYPIGTNLTATRKRVNVWMDRLAHHKDVARTDLQIGQDDEEDQPGERRGVHQARLTIQLKDLNQEEDFRSEIRSWAKREAGAHLTLSTPSLVNFATPLRIVAEGHILSDLESSEARIIRLLQDFPIITDIERTFGQGFPEVKLKYDYAKLAHRGVSPKEVADQLKGQLTGREALELIWKGERLPLIVRAEYAQSLNKSDLASLPIQLSRTRQQVPLSSLAQLKLGEGPAEIRHVDGSRAAEVTAHLSAAELDRTARLLSDRLARMTFPPGVDVKVSGQEQAIRQSANELTAVLFISLFLVFVVMATQFESIRLPLLIMGSVPLALAGVMIGLWFTSTPISVVVFVGMITLGGVVVNNAIVFIDAAEQIRFQHQVSQRDAILYAGERRLRPILMTTLTTLFGLIPMITTAGEGAELRSPLALTLIFGLGSSTLLVLYVIPSLYQLFAKRAIQA